MKRRIFDPGLFREGIRQLRLCGIVLTAFITLVVIVFPIRSAVAVSHAADGAAVIAEPVSGIGANPLLLLLFMIMAPLMTLMLFAFQNKRSSADFYHALPCTRACLYLSLISAVIAWLAAVAILTSGIALILYLILGRYFTLIIPSLVLYTLGCFVSGVMVAGAVSLAMSVTGTVFSNVLVSGLILFLPRVMIATVTGTLENALPMVTAGHVSALLGDGVNYVTGIFVLAFRGLLGANLSDVRDLLVSPSAIVYTLSLGILYVAAALILSCRRSSESAGLSAPNRHLQAVYRIGVTFFFCVFFAGSLFQSLIGYTDDSLTDFIVPALLILLFYFAYEVVTTKRWRNLVRALPGLLVLIGLNLLLLLSMYGLYENHLNFTPDENEINYVSVLSGNEYSDDTDLSFADYAGMTAAGVEVRNPEARRIVSAALSRAIETYRENPDNYYTHYEQPGHDQSYTEMSFRIGTASGTRYRTVYLSDAEVFALQTALETEPAYLDAWTQIPELLRNTVSVRQTYMYNQHRSLSGEDAAAVFRMFREEAATVPFVDWYAAVNESMTADFHLCGTVMDGNTALTLILPVQASLFPRTVALYLRSVIAAQSATVESTGTSVTDPEPGVTVSVEFRFFLHDHAEGGIDAYTVWISQDTADQTALSSLFGCLTDDISHITDDAAPAYCTVNVTTWTGAGTDMVYHETGDLIFLVKPDMTDTVKTLVSALNR